MPTLFACVALRRFSPCSQVAWFIAAVAILLGPSAMAANPASPQPASPEKANASDSVDVKPLSADEAWQLIAPHFQPPAEYKAELGKFRSPLLFADGAPVKTPEDWQRRRKEILATWHELMGPWPEPLEKPALEYLEESRRGQLTQHRVRVEVAPGAKQNGYLLIPPGKGPFPAVLVVYYDPETGAGLGKELRDFGYQLALRGFVTLSIGSPPKYRSPEGSPPLQPLSYFAYVAENCATILDSLSQVDGDRIGVVGHSYGGKWAMFASCLSAKFACGAWSDGGVVFDETRGNVNFWEPWYLGLDPAQARQPGIPKPDNPRTGAYAVMIEAGRDLHELHALMAPRPFLVSGGAEDRPGRWPALNHAIAVNRLLGHENRVAMTNRATHAPTPESNQQIFAFFQHFLQ